jgi:hypothetical protein
LEQTEPFSTLKTIICRKCPIQKLKQFSQGNSVLDATGSTVNGFLSRYTCVSSTQLNRPILTNKAYLHFEKPNLLEVFL